MLPRSHRNQPAAVRLRATHTLSQRLRCTSAIRNPQPNDLGRLTREAPGLRLIVHNGAESARRIGETRALGVTAVRLPSTSPANARLDLEAKLERWAEAFRQAGLGAPAP